MLSKKPEYRCADDPVWDVRSLSKSERAIAPVPTRFSGRFTDRMKMYAAIDTVANYLNSHSEWFCRCAQPMQVEAIDENAYALSIGRFGSFGYEVEPKIGLELLPNDNGVYRIKTIPLPNDTERGYDVDFQAVMELVETPTTLDARQLTIVEWQLDLTVNVYFPKFIQRLPKSLVQRTGDRLLQQIVCQVSRRLSAKVQQNFHAGLGIPAPLYLQRRNS